MGLGCIEFGGNLRGLWDIEGIRGESLLRNPQLCSGLKCETIVPSIGSDCTFLLFMSYVGTASSYLAAFKFPSLRYMEECGEATSSSIPRTLAKVPLFHDHR